SLSVTFRRCRRGEHPKCVNWRGSGRWHAPCCGAPSMNTLKRSMLLICLLSGCHQPDAATNTPADGGGGSPAEDGATMAPVPCTGMAGDFHDQSLMSGGEDRRYFL